MTRGISHSLWRVSAVFILFIDRACIGVTPLQRKAVYTAFAYSAEYTVLKTVVRSFKRCKKIFHIFALGVLVLGAGVFHYGGVAPACEVLNVALGCVDKRAYKGNFSV